jgi:hypothetical protein
MTVVEVTGSLNFTVKVVEAPLTSLAEELIETTSIAFLASHVPPVVSATVLYSTRSHLVSF